MVADVLVIGAGPAGAAIAAELCDRGLNVAGLAPQSAQTPWVNTYGIWVDELEKLGLQDLLAHSWADSVSYFTQGQVNHQRSYGLFDKTKLQSHLLERGQAVQWHQDKAKTIQHFADHSCITTQTGKSLKAKVVIDTSGHEPIFIQRSQQTTISFQAAYGIVGRFSKPPVDSGQFVLMDYRSDHLSPPDKIQTPPTFLYAMDFGNDIYFVEETSLSATPPVGFDVLERRLKARLSARNVQITEVHEVERCLFPMNLPMPDLTQPVIGFGGAASMVHPATGYMVGALLRRSPSLADAITTALDQPKASPHTIAKSAWQTLWNQDQLRKYYLYRFGLEKLMRFEEERLLHFFETFFNLPQHQWAGFLANTLSTTDLVIAMINLFGKAPNDVRWGLMKFAQREAPLLWQSITA